MATAVPFRHIISVSSETEGTSANNCINNHKGKVWKARPGEKAIIELQLERSVLIDSINIGNAGSGMITILGGSTTWPPEQKLVPVLPISNLMTSSQAKSLENLQGVSIFTKEKLIAGSISQRFDKIRIELLQPWVQNPFGLTFVEIFAPPEPKKETPPPTPKLGAFRMRTVAQAVKASNTFQAKGLPAAAKKVPSTSSSAASSAVPSKSPEATKPKVKTERNVRALPPWMTKGPSTSNTSSSSTKKPPKPTVKSPTTSSSNASQTSKSTKSTTAKSSKDSSKSQTYDKGKQKEKATASSSSESSNDTSKKKLEKNNKIPFGKILENVVFVLSGFQNPYRDQIRKKALAMGASYEGQWKSNCTHLVCAFANTPKFKEVEAKGGCIVKKEWILDQHELGMSLDANTYQMGGPASSNSGNVKKLKRRRTMSDSESDDGFGHDQKASSDDDYIPPMDPKLLNEPPKKRKAGEKASAKIAMAVDTDDDDDDDDEDDKEESAIDEDDEQYMSEEKEDDEEVKDENVAYISRSEAYGTKPGVQSYVPPAKRAQENAPEELRRRMKGLLNRLNESNLVPIMKDVESVFLKHSRNHASATLSGFIMEACLGNASTLKHLQSVYAACICCLHHVVGVEVSAYFLQKLVEHFQKAYDEACQKEDMGDVVTKVCANFMILISNLFNFTVIHGALICQLLGRLSKDLKELDLELILVCLKVCSGRLRSDKSKEYVEFRNEFMLNSSKKSGQNPRSKFMTSEIIANLKKGKKDRSDGTDLTNLNKQIKALLKHRKLTSKEPLRVSWEDIVEADTRGRWWLVGSAWAGVGAGSNRQTVAKENTKVMEETTDPDGLREVAMEAAAMQRMNTDVKRRIFLEIMSSEDYLDAFERLLKLGLKNKQDREIMRVILDCCIQEKAFNPFYAHLAVKMCNHSHNNKISLQYACWDKIKTLEDLDVRQLSLFSKFLVHIFITGTMPLSTLKVVNFQDLGPKGVVMFRTLFTSLLTNYSRDEILPVIERLVVHKEMANLKAGILMFSKHYLKGKALKDEAKQNLLKERVRLMNKLLSKELD
eukprot:m.64481 g.64481  ORF g.64481 m.64481 type:complete len:1058 (-) comp11653_c1_seq1:47-3220(-)